MASLSVNDSECPICCKNFNLTTRKSIECIKCDMVICIGCIKEYMGTSEEQIKCMSCGVDLPIFHFVGKTSKTFYRRDIRNHNRDIKFKEQVSMLAATMPLVEVEKEKERLHKENRGIDEFIRDLRAQIDSLYRQKQINYNKIYYGMDEVSLNKEKKAFIRPCPVDDCRGFLSSRWKCGVCNVNVCSDCLGIMEEEHKCNSEDVESAKIIQSKTKPCPECGARIMKSEGCDHMFCTACDTGFSWRTGLKISNSKNTNPYYYEWLKRNGNNSRVAGDVRCGGAPGVNDLQYHLRKYDTMLINFRNLHRCLMHTYHIEMPRYNPANLGDNTDLRVSYLMNKIDEKHWKDEFGSRLKKQEKYEDIFNIFSMFYESMSEFLIQLINTTDQGEITDLCMSIKNFRKYINNQFVNLVEIYNNVIPYIHKEWRVTSIDTRLNVRKF